MPFGYPVMLELAGRRCVVIGSLAVREGKVEGLLAAGATDVLVVASAPDARLTDLEELPEVVVERRTWRADDLNGAFVVVASSADAGEREAIAREARCRRALVNVMDDIPNCDWSAPAIVRRGELVLSIATGGASPALAKQLRAALSRGVRRGMVRGGLGAARGAGGDDAFPAGRRDASPTLERRVGPGRSRHAGA